MHVHPGGNKSLFTLHILSVVYGSPLESDMYSGLMHVYIHVCVRKYQTIYRDSLWLPTCKKTGCQNTMQGNGLNTLHS